MLFLLVHLPLSGRKQRRSRHLSTWCDFKGHLCPIPQGISPQVLTRCQSASYSSHAAQFFKFKGNCSGKCWFKSLTGTLVMLESFLGWGIENTKHPFWELPPLILQANLRTGRLVLILFYKGENWHFETLGNLPGLRWVFENYRGWGERRLWRQGSFSCFTTVSMAKPLQKSQHNSLLFSQYKTRHEVGWGRGYPESKAQATQSSDQAHPSSFSSTGFQGGKGKNWVILPSSLLVRDGLALIHWLFIGWE